MANKLPARPNLDHLRRQAKTLLAQLKDGKAPAARAFIDHLPEARGMTTAAVRTAGYRLADAQSVVARQTGFASWPALSRHVQELRALEGDWRFSRLEIDGAAVPAEILSEARLLIDGDRFRSESHGATYEGIFTIDVEATPPQIDIEFIEGPDAGNWCYGLYELNGDQLTFCLGLVGAKRPTAFVTKPGSGHALEHLRRVSPTRPINVKGGTRRPVPAPEPEAVDPAAFDVDMTPLLRRLEGTWVPVELVRDGEPMTDQWLSFGSRTTVGNDVTVVFGGQTIVHAKMRIDDAVTPIAIDYLHLGPHAGRVSRGIMDWIGDDLRILMPKPGDPRPADFDDVTAGCTLSRWRRRS